MARVRSGGVIRTVTGTNPAAGAEVSETVPAGKEWRLLSIAVALVTSATAATRRPHLLIDDGTTVSYRRASNATQAASLTQNYVFAGEGPEAAVRGTWVADPLPSLPLGAGYRIRTSTESIQAGDDYGAPVLLVEEFDVT